MRLLQDVKVKGRRAVTDDIHCKAQVQANGMRPTTSSKLLRSNGVVYAKLWLNVAVPARTVAQQKRLVR